MTEKLQEILDTYTNEAGPIPADPARRNAWFLGLVQQAFRAARSSRYPAALRVWDEIGRQVTGRPRTS